MSVKKRFVQVGVGARGKWYFHSLVDKYQKYAELVGLCDNNRGRLLLAGEEMHRKGINVPLYQENDFERMIKETRPDCVIVTTRDCFHDKYICKAMEMGCDVITEKPMTINVEKCRRIIETKKKTKRRCVVTFNYRYSPPRTQIKDLLMTGAIGNVVSVDFHWLLNTSHGADYFRRWHRNKENSGGLLVHKATHHFDLVNWWLSTVPESVFAVGKRNFYTPETAKRYGLNKRSERCLNCPEKKKCRFYLDLSSFKDLKSLYLDNEQYDGYFRDKCLFSKEIDIEDTMHVIVKYRNGATMSYSLHAFMPWEGYIIAFNGTRGRLEHKCMESVYVSGDGTVPGELLKAGTSTVIFPHFGKGYSVPIWEGTGGHGGGDDPLLDDLFLPRPPRDKYLRAADERAGAYSILTGIAANISINEKREIIISDLVDGIDMPDYPPMPSSSEPLDPAWQHPSAKIAAATEITKAIATPLQKKKCSIEKVKLPPMDLFSITLQRSGVENFHDIRPVHNGKDGIVYLKAKVQMKQKGKGRLLYGADGPVKVWINGKEVDCRPDASNPIVPGEYMCTTDWLKGKNEIIFAIDTNCGKAWGVVAECKY